MPDFVQVELVLLKSAQEGCLCELQVLSQQEKDAVEVLVHAGLLYQPGLNIRNAAVVLLSSHDVKLVQHVVQ